jgi:gliding motility-associated peptidyl-prolyl isomerase
MKIAYFTIALALFSCKEEKQQMELINSNWNQDESINMNAQFSAEEDEEIEFFLARHTDWKVKETGTGLRYMIYHKSESMDSAKIGDIVTLNFEVSLLTGEVCYSSQENGAESFMVERSDIESGLQEGVKLMCLGDKGKFILPSHMAHGLIGDSEKIPPLSTVIYDIELIKIEKP